jgi:Secretion system C-terminal sorting domain
MKKLLLSLSVFVSFANLGAQNLVTENFDGLTNPIVLPTGWVQTNQSVPVGSIGWFQGGGSTASPTFPGFNGGANGYIGCNFNSTTGSNTISNWLISPSIDVQNGDVVSFYTRKTTNPATPTTMNTFADRLEFRYSENGDFTVNPAGGNTNVGEFTNIALTINPTLALIGYPDTWTQYTYTMTGLPGITSVKFAFRYWVTLGGPTGANSDYIGIDAFSVDRPVMATELFFTKNFIVFPNPANNVINVLSKNATTITQIQITDINGRVVKNLADKLVTSEVNIADLTAGVYFVKVTSDLGSGTTKIVKQ